MLSSWLAIFLLALLPSLTLCEPYSIRMLNSIISRQQGVITSGAPTSTLESGVVALALHDAITQYSDHNATLDPYLDQVLAVITPNLTNVTADAKLPLDRFSIANALLTKSQSSSLTTTESNAFLALTESFSLQARNPANGLWYYVYPQWSYLDGIFSVLPFMASQTSPNFTDIALQISLLKEYCVHDSGLLVHGYDYSKTAVWANPVTGGSPYVWGRSLGWFMSGLVQTYEILCTYKKESAAPMKPTCNLIQDTFTSLVHPLLSFADNETGAWWQLTTFPEREGNFLESSSTVLFIFSLLKAARIELIPQSDTPHGPAQHHGFDSSMEQPSHGLAEKARAAAMKAYHYTTSNFVIDYGNGTIGFDKTVVVNSLNSTASYEYYTTRPILPNSLLGEGGFVLGSLEVERLQESR